MRRDAAHAYTETVISIHAPQWGATGYTARTPPGLGFQSTHPSGVRRGIATARRRVHNYFNPRTPVGCDIGVRLQRFRELDFNPRTPVGCDVRVAQEPLVEAISIHAPQWGATGVALTAPRRRWHFNPRTPVGCDRSRGKDQRYSSYFNPRTPVGCDRLEQTPNKRQPYFNPRTPVGCDQRISRANHEYMIFQSTHPSGVRPGRGT